VIEDNALKMWQKKLQFFQREQAILSDPEQKWSLEVKIDECREQIKALEQTPTPEPKLPEGDRTRELREKIKADFADRKLTNFKEKKLISTAKMGGLSETEARKLIEEDKAIIEKPRILYRELLDDFIKESFPLNSDANKSLAEFQFETKLLDWEVQEIYQSVVTHQEDLGRGIILEMVAIPRGKFMMGSNEFDDEKPIHEVTVSSFYMGKYPVTQEQWKAIALLDKIDIDLNPNPSYFKGDKKPIDSVSWNMGVEFCKRLSKLTGKDYRLPSEAEWEYACRAGTTSKYYFGDDLDPSLANYDRNLGCTSLVGSFPPNAFGLYDMHGNVWEWCLDDWHANYNGCPTDGSAWLNINNSQEGIKYKCLRGGSWLNGPQNCRSAYRLSYDIDHSFVGFRPAFSFQDSSPLHS
jgi:formylglycine-generating enzyme required for sulfatase activity